MVPEHLAAGPALFLALGHGEGWVLVRAGSGTRRSRQTYTLGLEKQNNVVKVGDREAKGREDGVY